MGGVPFEVFVQIPAQIVKPSETLRELARRLRFGQNVSNMVETGANWCKRAISGRQCIAMAATVLGISSLVYNIHTLEVYGPYGPDF